MKNQSQEYYTPIQLKMPVEMERMIEVDDPVYSFNEVLRHMDLKKYFVQEEEHKTGRPEYGAETLLKVVLFAFMEEGYESTRKIKKLCRTDIRFMWLLDGKKAPSHMTISNFINHELKASIEEIFRDINAYIFEKESVDLRHIYIVSAEKRIKGSQNQGMQMETGKKRGKSVQEARKCGIMKGAKNGVL